MSIVAWFLIGAAVVVFWIVMTRVGKKVEEDRNRSGRKPYLRINSKLAGGPVGEGIFKARVDRRLKKDLSRDSETEDS